MLAATTLPVLLLGGEVAADQEAPVRAVGARRWPTRTCAGMVVGRSLLYPPDGDVAAAVDATVEMM